LAIIPTQTGIELQLRVVSAMMRRRCVMLTGPPSVGCGRRLTFDARHLQRDQRGTCRGKASSPRSGCDAGEAS
jgi:hypothetical protein